MTLSYVFQEFDKIRIVGSTNDKKQLLKSLLSKEPRIRDIFEIVYGDTNFNLSTRSIEKITGFTKEDFNYSDAGELIEFYLRDSRKDEYFLWYDFEVFFDKCSKLTGNALLDYCKQTLFITHPHNAKWIVRILIKDLKLGISLLSMNKVLKSLDMKTIDKFEVQLADSVKDLETWDKFPVLAGIKYDGFRAIINKKGDEVIITSRQGKNVDFVPEIIEHLKKDNRDFILDGEIMAKDFNSIQKRIGRKLDNIEEVEDLHFRLFDILSFEGKDMTQVQQIDRTSFIKDTFENDRLLRTEKIVVVNDKKTLLNLYKYAILCNEEGIMLKFLHSPYVFGSRKNWFKVKQVTENSFKVIGFDYGSGKYKNTIGALKVISGDNKIKAKVGSGLNDYTRQYFLDKVKDNSLVGTIVEVRYNEITKSGDNHSLRHPRLLKVRDDIDKADIIQVS